MVIAFCSSNNDVPAVGRLVEGPGQERHDRLDRGGCGMLLGNEVLTGLPSGSNSLLHGYQ